MKYANIPFILILAASLALGTTSCQAPAQEKREENDSVASPQGKLFIIGGGKRPAPLVERLVQEAGLREGGWGIILPMSSAEQDSSIYYAKIQFTEAGLSNVDGFEIYDASTLRQSQLDSIRQARMIYISGGDQNRFMEIAGNTLVVDAIKGAYQQGATIAGTSAGAALMSKKMITGNELKHPDYAATFQNIETDNIELKAGLGLLPTAIVDQHFVKRSRHNRLLSAVIEHPQLLGIGIDEATAILVKNDSAEVVGDSQVLVFSNPNASKEEKDGLLGAKSLQLDIYLPTQQFSLTFQPKP